ncbi:Chemotaxis methyl-accepting receptor [Agrobacterium albertimagni AOL15]|uniref:Chemotaxis methyl-accepting receptor n=1 Tax=Agrobacterium albertimagni AOL15 TaxID=1156935 RepID=K2Q885_9HYPH|nr:PAS domain-containing methyl-accepting chemotaxis protein [Agrobacterium albertimagni]EKF61405.1 Chemotaxis methyl-accepting receptor [Agrobacterium albertimagni AOL15]
MALIAFPGLESKAVLDALGRSQAVIEFKLDGTIITANENFCRALGYSLEEIKGKHHRIFCDPTYTASADYREFWAMLNRGQFESREYKRMKKSGGEVWIQASYNPVFRNGKLWKIVKFATDITAAKLRAAEDAGKLEAISRVQATIEFTPTGEILTANENFLATLGYTLSEIAGKHHSMFCEADYARSDAYRDFWKTLASGQFVSEEFKRIGKGGKIVWIQASYNPIFDASGRVFKVVKYATDITGRVNAVDEIARGLTALAHGDLTATIDKPFIPSLEQIRTDFNAAMARVAAAMQNVSCNTDAIASGSSQIREASDSLSKRTEQQAAAVEETAAALEQITQTVADSSKRASEAGKLVARTKEGAERSGLVVRNAIEAMSQIENSSKQISNILGVIDDIAFQTNLLALNAGVEAARAGEAGKGFAVVAQEVRELAQRSATAAKEIKALISTSTDQVKTGVQLVGETGKALEQIVIEVKDINTNVAAIVEASREQSTGLCEINKAVNAMDQNTQQNAAMVEESTAASHSLAKQAASLRELVSQFRIGQHSSHKVMEARPDASPVASPARKLMASVARATGGAAAAKVQEGWEDF